MPELPEGETVRRVLGPLCAGRRIERVSVRRPEVIAHPGAEEFCARLAGRETAGLGRRGKFLSILLADGGRVTLHLRMTGCLLLAPADHPEERHTHVVFALDGGEELRFSDMRRWPYWHTTIRVAFRFRPAKICIRRLRFGKHLIWWAYRCSSTFW